MKYYSFTPKQWARKQKGLACTFYKLDRKYLAMFDLEKGYIVFKHEQGIPNPWFVRQVTKKGLGKLKCI